MIISILIIIFINIFQTNQLIVRINYDTNNTFIIYYNLTTNVSYYLTFRVFEYEQIEFGLFSSNIHENTLHINNQYHSPYLFIICFHFFNQLYEIDIQCKDIRFNETQSMKNTQASYKPLFIPMMYTLSILMLLPVIIQHRHQKYVEILERRKQIRRLSLTIIQDHQNIFSDLTKRTNINSKILPIDIDLVSIPSTKTILDDINDNVTFRKTKPRILINEYDKHDIEITADDCIAHLLDNTPWTTTPIIIQNSTNFLDDQHTPVIINDNKFNELYRLNCGFIESEV